MPLVQLVREVDQKQNQEAEVPVIAAELLAQKAVQVYYTFHRQP